MAVRRWNITIAIPSPPIELHARRRSGSTFQGLRGLPDHIDNALCETGVVLAHDRLAFLCGCYRSLSALCLKRFGEPDRQRRLIGSVHDFEAPLPPILTLAVTLCDHPARIIECLLPCSLKAGMRDSFRILDHAARGPDVEVVKRGMLF